MIKEESFEITYMLRHEGIARTKTAYDSRQKEKILLEIRTKRFTLVSIHRIQ